MDTWWYTRTQGDPMTKTRTKVVYTTEFQQEAVRLVTTQGLS